MEEFDLDEILFGCEQLPSGDYRTSYGKVIPDPDHYRHCEVCDYQTYRRVIAMTKYGLIDSVRVLCPKCCAKEEAERSP